MEAFVYVAMLVRRVLLHFILPPPHGPKSKIQDLRRNLDHQQNAPASQAASKS